MKKYKLLIGIIGMIIVSCSFSIGQCVQNHKDRGILAEIEKSLRLSIPEIDQYPALVNTYFVYDLADTSNNSIFSFTGDHPKSCVEMIDGHVYHFSVTYLAFSRSSIGVLDAGKLRIFRSINCRGDGASTLDDVEQYLKQMRSGATGEDMTERLRRYRNFGSYRSTDETKVVCREK